MTGRSLAGFDRDLARKIGINEAIVFEWLWGYLHSKASPAGFVEAGRRWATFSYETLHLQSDVLSSQKTLQRAVYGLETIGLIISTSHRDGKNYAIRFAKLKEILDPDHYQEYVNESNVDGLDDWDME
jgi:hypothetical protein